jgi:hypothetical protein
MSNQASQTVDSNHDGIVVDVNVCDTSDDITVVLPTETAEDIRRKDPLGVYTKDPLETFGR